MLRACFSAVAFALSATASATQALDLATPATSPWALQLSGTAQHFQKPLSRKHAEWNQKNWGIGIQYDDRAAGSAWTRTYSAGALIDSYGVNGGYAAVAQYRDLFSSHGVNGQAGLGLFALWRATNWQGDREFLLVPLPVAHFEHPATGIGLNIVVSPTVHSSRYEIPGFVFFQLTTRF